MDLSRSDTIRKLVVAWYMGKGQQVPSGTVLSAIVASYMDDLATIPMQHLNEAWRRVKAESTYLPESPRINAVWRDICSEIPKIGSVPPRKHECKYCVVVATRLKTLPDPTDWDLEMATLPITVGEIKCVLAYIGDRREIVEYWNTNQKSPYRGML